MDVEVKPSEQSPSDAKPGLKDRAGAFAQRVAASPAAARAKAMMPKGRRARIALISILALVLIAGGAWYFWPRTSTTQPVIARVERGDVEDAVTALGNLQPRDYVDVGAQASGQLKKLHVDIGAVVKSGDLLAEIDPQIQAAKVAADEAQLKNLRAQQAERQAQLDLARGQFNRQKMLKAANATSLDAYQSAESALRAAEAQVNATKAQIEQTTSTLEGDKVTLGYTKIYAPMAGTVVSLTARQGQTLNANQTAPIILRIADLSTMTVWTQVSEADVPKLKVGMEAYFTILGTPGKKWTGKLRQVLPTPEVVNNVVLYTALFDVENKAKDLMTQMTAQVFFVVSGKKDVLVVPVAALTKVRGSKDTYKVTVATGRGQREEREVKIGVQNRVSAEVISGLEEGDRVVAGTRTQRDRSSSDNQGGRGGNRGGGGGPRFGGFP